MILSVIIVNYRVRYFLELCLHSVGKALADLGAAEAEIIVVDNASGDGSIEALRPLFPRVRFVENKENAGFAKANNQALRLASGEYILFLNPDTVLPEDFARVCLGFLRDNQGAGQTVPDRSAKAAPGRRGIGALGVRMIDGSGRFLPESRRGFPSPWVAFTRLSGLSALFPRSRFFAGYYLGHLPADRAHPAPVLSGACLFIRRTILDEVGGFDERFFMYAEDIDLSYRIERAGYTNYYFPGATIIHFKGESTQKDIRYVRQFHLAMSQFRRKHFNRGLPALWNLGMEAAIWFRAGIGTLGRAGTRAGTEPKAHIWITGDPAEAERLKKALASQDPSPASGVSKPGPSPAVELATGPQTADLVLFCEGPTFSFQACIIALEAETFRKKEQRALFHASGSQSAAGSADRHGRGETLVF